MNIHSAQRMQIIGISVVSNFCRLNMFYGFGCCVFSLHHLCLSLSSLTHSLTHSARIRALIHLAGCCRRCCYLSYWATVTM